MASPGFSALLVLEIEGRQARPTSDQSRSSCFDPAHVQGERQRGAPQIQSELNLLGHTVAESTVAKYMVRPHQPPSQTWRTFLDNHVPDLVGIDFFTVSTATFRVLYCFVVLRHDRRRVVHFHVTTNPTARWTAQQVVEAFPFEEAPRYLIRDRDGLYGDYFRDRVKNMGIDEVVIAPRSPWQNPYCERVIGSRSGASALTT